MELYIQILTQIFKHYFLGGYKDSTTNLIILPKLEVMEFRYYRLQVHQQVLLQNQPEPTTNLWEISN